MKRILLILSALLFFPAAYDPPVFSCSATGLRVAGEEDNRTLVMFWNLENFFDWKRDSLDGNESDAEFSSFGKKHWTRRRFLTKCNAIAKSILWISDSYGMLPDVVGVAEVENRFVLEMLLHCTSLCRTDYKIVHYESPDPRGIDVALLYRESRLELLRSVPLKVGNSPQMMTRDILLTEFRNPEGDSMAVLVNHHPSKYGGKTGSRREIALRRLRDATDSVQRSGVKNVLAMGDFNDTPDNPAFGILTEGQPYPLTNLAMPLAAKGEGTIRYSGKWELIDMFFGSEDLVKGRHIEGIEIVRLPFLMTRDNAHSGEKPLRTYTGPRYAGGVSDHCPIVVAIR
jgi:endonuclease/exonuclease/phosphatase family metal-dependent hydrolase